MKLVLPSLFLALAIPAYAANILVVSDANDPAIPDGNHEDDELVYTLQGLGHTVNTFGMGGAMQGDWSTNPDAVNAVNAAHLIVVSRRTNSGAYNQPTLWKSTYERAASAA